MGKKAQISEDRRETINLLYKNGIKPTEISKQMNISLVSVYRMIAKKTNKSLSIKPRSGRPRSTTIRQDRLLIRKSLKNRFASTNELKQQCSLDCNVRTIQRRLNENDLKSYKPLKKAVITKKQAQNRLVWCLNHVKWTSDDWKKV